MYIKAKELAQRLGVTISTVYNLMNAGKIPAGVKFGKSRRWNWNEVEECIKGGKNNER